LRVTSRAAERDNAPPGLVNANDLAAGNHWQVGLSQSPRGSVDFDRRLATELA
jgi:hypothetical protein